MRKALLLFYFITIVPLAVLSQSTLRELTFSVSSEKTDVQHKSSYIIQNDTVFQNRMIINGKASFQIAPNICLDSLYFALSDQEEHIYRINIGALINYGKSVSTPIGKIAVVSNQLIAAPNQENISVGGILSSSFRFPDLSYFTKEWQMGKYGYLRWYFPTELLINKDSIYDDYLSQWYNAERYYHDLGHYPKEGFIDSIKMKRFEERAENLAGWYSEQLIMLDEPILCDGYPKEVYRLTWSNNAFYFTYNPYCMRIEVDQDEAVLFCSYYKWDNCTGYQFYCDIIPLEKTTYYTFIELFNKSNFLSEKPILDNGGSNYIFESYKDELYHVIFRGKGENENLDEIQQFLWTLPQLGKNEMVQLKQRIE